MSPTVAAAAEQAEQLKENGNHCFQKNKFSAAIDFYTEAITLCPNVPVYWTNRALCHRRRNDWLRLEEDCRRAIQLDHNSVKAHYMLGLALLQKKDYSEGVRELEKALDLGRGADPKSYMVEEIWQELGNAKYLEWEHESTSRSWEQQNLKESCEAAFKKKYLLDSSEAEGSSDEQINHLAEQLEALNLVFKKAAEDDTPTEVPDYLCCNITLEIFRDPVITPSGFTYERAVILNHLQKVGNFDPITREPLNTCQLIPNLAIKEAVQSYLAKHGWAYRTD
ncbi:E3 ubiquitin-protein ligase CHIP isoform X1 [Ipomoea triloba]|uniref:E3 ubiquitin-protein ligase CHIP isoform X1 n=1 Tax=Ipomoea triloba TaxID=35885 RepID=UPI00125D7976|nr:E3 ubiquitin-protein ligase CHIP isoform X1 [Ipomoea triloba]GMD61156.1 E3 ubiquitin-protein ligase chip [Ipomoea batatas]